MDSEKESSSRHPTGKQDSGSFLNHFQTAPLPKTSNSCRASAAQRKLEEIRV
jgi:hypothetical protein